MNINGYKKNKYNNFNYNCCKKNKCNYNNNCTLNSLFEVENFLCNLKKCLKCLNLYNFLK